MKKEFYKTIFLKKQTKNQWKNQCKNKKIETVFIIAGYMEGLGGTILDGSTELKIKRCFRPKIDHIASCNT